MTTVAPPEQARPQLAHRQIMLLMGGLMTGMLLAALDQTIVGTALPTIVGELGGLDHYSWVVTAYLLASTASTPLYGKISDLYGRRPVLLFAISTFLVGSLLAGMSQDMTQLIATRALQGIGAGGLMTLAFTIVSDVVAPRERARYQGLFGAVSASPRWPGRWSAATSPRPTGAGSSTSTSRSASSRCTCAAGSCGSCRTPAGTTRSTTWVRRSWSLRSARGCSHCRGAATSTPGARPPSWACWPPARC